MHLDKSIVERISPPIRQRIRLVGEALNIGVLGLSSFIALYYRGVGNAAMKYVIATGAIAYALVLLTQAILLRKNEDRISILFTTKKVFRLIYTAIYLTCVMLEILAAAEHPGTEKLLSYYGFLFIWVALWGTNCLWLKKVWTKIATLLKSA